jgi:hypothetical protein
MSSRAEARLAKRDLNGAIIPASKISAQNLRTAAVLPAAVTVDTLARRSRSTT